MGLLLGFLTIEEIGRDHKLSPWSSRFARFVRLQRTPINVGLNDYTASPMSEHPGTKVSDEAYCEKHVSQTLSLNDSLSLT